LTLYELFFEMEVSICERFPSLSPFDVRRERASEVFLLMRRMQKYNKSQDKTNPKNTGKQVIRRPAKDDWF
jgi:hypothetical protein